MLPRFQRCRNSTIQLESKATVIRLTIANRHQRIDRKRSRRVVGAIAGCYRKPIDQCLGNEFWKGQLDSELTWLDALILQLKSIETKLNEIGKKGPRVVRITTMDEVGPRTAEALVEAIDDLHQFNNARQVSAYFGLVPKQYQSGEPDRNGRISKRGPSLIRTLLVQAARN